MIPSPAIHMVPVMTFRLGTGQELQPSRRANLGPNRASINGQKISPATTPAGTKIDVTRAGPSFTN